ncbi:lysozyme [Streptomyces sp. 7-21]|jgi:GH25 family lysozyme M1 (1,4-beta-N-acetylmuramidase)|uniref:lysozyme n=1 Tax=Streptomyces sp. 7-21 TaxID=2802283 RepID=UPI00191D1FAF|nr:lysozyme [Streptomyces sp. 7-21]MBL1065123.1 lysozyme [Streptomyces sp. 7-21]
MPMNRTAPSAPKPRHRTLSALLASACAALAAVLTLPGTARADDTGPLPISPGEAYMGVTVPYYEETSDPLTVTRPPQGSPRATVEGVDVSSWQGNVDWPALWDSGVRWAYVKATEGTSYKNPYFTQQYNGSYDIGMIRGAYHFALPNSSSGIAQADYFADNGGGWSRDGKTLPGVLDIEYNPYGSACYGLSDAEMVDWIDDFLTRYYERTGRWAVIYTTDDWWAECTGNYSGFANHHPLWIAEYASSPGTLPAGWSYYTFWQYTSSGPIVGDHNLFNGASDRLQALANND